MNPSENKPRILWVANWRVKGGISIVTDHFMKDPAIQAAYDVKVQDQSFPGVWNENPLLKVLKIPRGIALILWNCLRFKPDIVHIHTPYRNGFLKDGLMAILAKWLGHKVVLTFHPGSSMIDDYNHGALWLKAWSDFVLPRCDALIALGKSYQEFMIERFHHPLVALIPNPVDDEQVAKTPQDYDQRTPIVFFAGLLNERKGAFDLMRAIDKVKLQEVKFIIQGSAPRLRDKALFQQLYDACQSKDKVQLETWKPVFENMNRARVVVLPSYGESMPIIIAEAMACGVPVITTPIGVLPDYVQHGVNGLLIKPGDIDGLAHAIEYVLTHPQWASEVSRTNAEFGKIFLRSQVHRSLVQVYDQLLKIDSK